jgi:hypothetical protein
MHKKEMDAFENTKIPVRESYFRKIVQSSVNLPPSSIEAIVVVVY